MTRCEELMVKGTLDNYHLLGFNPQEILFTEASTLITALKGCRALIFFFFFFFTGLYLHLHAEFHKKYEFTYASTKRILNISYCIIGFN